MSDATSKYLDHTLEEEISHAISHGLGLILSIAGLILLIVKGIASGNPTALIAYIIYGSSLILLFTSSTFSHALTHKKAKHLFQYLDYTSIYVLIAGTYTPVLLIGLNTPASLLLLWGIWGLALAGILYKVFFLGKHELISTILYLMMGWSCMFILNEFMTKLSPGFLYFVAFGGVCYSIGTIFYMAVRFKFSHFIWHLLVLAGSIALFIGILLEI